MNRFRNSAVVGRVSELGQRLGEAARRRPWLDLAAVVIGLGLAVAIRYSLLDFKSVDYFSSLKPWYNTIKSEGFQAFATGFSNYNPPYLYLLYMIIRLFPDLPLVVAVKLPALVADFICAALVYLIVRLKSKSGSALPALAALIVLFTPTIVLNSSFWGQADSIFTAGLLGCVYCLMVRRPWLAMLLYGLALAFKLQALFLAPVLLAFACKGMISWKALLLVPAVLIGALIPSWLAGRPILDLLGVYLNQTSQYESITMNAPSAYAWLPGTKQVFNLLYLPGIIMGACAAFMWFIIIWRSPRAVLGAQPLELALCAVIVIPFFLPKMHERYFYPADVLSVAFAFLYPSLFYIPILVAGVSFVSYQPFLFETELVPLPILTLVMLVAIYVLTHHAVSDLYSPVARDGESPESAARLDAA